jgi:hypothetical protein
MDLFTKFSALVAHLHDACKSRINIFQKILIIFILHAFLSTCCLTNSHHLCHHFPFGSVALSTACVCSRVVVGLPEVPISVVIIWRRDLVFEVAQGGEWVAQVSEAFFLAFLSFCQYELT